MGDGAPRHCDEDSQDERQREQARASLPKRR
jgi:hypothetical protein